jgi:peptide subunit release factor 1 (eRF1)
MAPSASTLYRTAMISRHDLERLLNQPDGEHRILSLFLDMSVNSDNKRTYGVFLAKKKAEFQELSSDRPAHHREVLGAAFARIEQWIEDEFEEENRGVVIYAELGGDWFEALQFPVPVANRLVVDVRPLIAPLAQVIDGYDHHGVVLIDRGRARILSVYLGTLLDEVEIHNDTNRTPHDVQAGGYSQSRYQRRKDEEMRSFFRDFAKEVQDFVRRYQPDDLVILGTDENIGKFREFLPESLLKQVVYTGPMSVDDPAPEVLARLEPHLHAERDRESEALLKRLGDRVRQDYLATAGYRSTLAALQEGRVDTLVLERDRAREGSRCTQCGFVFGRVTERCPFDDAETTPVADVVDEMLRLAEAQGAEVEFVDPGAAAEVRGAGALLRF